MAMDSAEELTNKLWTSLPKTEQENLSHETFVEAVKLTRMEFLDLMMDFYEEGFDAGMRYDPFESGTPDAFKKRARQLFTASLPD